MKFSTVATIALVAAIGLGAGYPEQANAKRGDGNRMEQLTPEQQAKYKKIMEENRLATADLRKELDVKRTELNALLQNENPDKTRIEALSTEIGALRGKLLSASVDTNAELKKEGLPARRLGNAPRSSGKRDGKGARPPRGERPQESNI